MKVRLSLIAVIALALGFVTAPVLAQAGAGVGVSSAPFITNKAVYVDANHDGVSQPGELLGAYDVFDPQLYLNFYWTPITGATYYRISLIQYPPPNIGPDGPSQEISIAHHSASDPNKTRFSLTVTPRACLDCVTVIHVVPETVTIGRDAKGANIYQYTDLPGGLISAPFVFELPRPASSGGGSLSPACSACGDGVCSGREKNVGGLCWCPADC